jgi:pyruvate/2-oxoglutarate dehydrogenase complex dihydrolipoamide acyltransferase (E2) component
VAAGSEYDDRVELVGSYGGKRTSVAAAAAAAQATAASKAALLPKPSAKDRRELAARERELAEGGLDFDFDLDDGLQRKKFKKDRKLDAEADAFFQETAAAAAAKKQQRQEQHKCGRAFFKKNFIFFSLSCLCPCPCSRVEFLGCSDMLRRRTMDATRRWTVPQTAPSPGRCRRTRG